MDDESPSKDPGGAGAPLLRLPFKALAVDGTPPAVGDTVALNGEGVVVRLEADSAIVRLSTLNDATPSEAEDEAPVPEETEGSGDAEMDALRASAAAADKARENALV